MKPPARRVSVIAREQWERKGRLFCLSGNTSSPQNCPEFLLAAAGFICGSFHFALRIYIFSLFASDGCCEDFMEKEALWSGVVGIKFLEIH